MRKLLMLVPMMALLMGCQEPLPKAQQAFAGLWKSDKTSLLITDMGRLEYRTEQNSVTTEYSLPIKQISESQIEAGFLISNASFSLGGKPATEKGLHYIVVDGEKLYKTDHLGNVPQANVSLQIDEIRALIDQDLRLLSESIIAQDFSEFIHTSSLMFQSKVDNDQLLQGYKPFIDHNIVVTEWMTGEFVLTSEPVIDAQGILYIKGKYPKTPNSLKFNMRYIFAYPQWKRVGADLNINAK